MKLGDLSRRLPDEVGRTFEPVRPPVVWCGNGRPPWDNRSVLHGLLYGLISGVGGEMVPPCFPCAKTIRTRLKTWLQLDGFRTAWRQLAGKYERRHGINGDKILIDGSKHKAPQGGRHRTVSRRPRPVRHGHSPRDRRARDAAGGHGDPCCRERRSADRRRSSGDGRSTSDATSGC